MELCHRLIKELRPLAEEIQPVVFLCNLHSCACRGFFWIEDFDCRAD